MEAAVFVVAGLICLAGALGVVLSRNPVHSALSLVGTLFGVAVLFLAQEANFLAAVQVIVYAGAIVVLFLFVIMLLGVDQVEDVEEEPIRGQRPAALITGLLVAVGLVLVVATGAITGTEGGRAVEEGTPDVVQLGRLLFTDYLFAFEITSVLLVVAVVGAVVLARARRADQIDLEEPVDEIVPAVGADAEDLA